jgi:cobalt-precorrin-5B (C1)-methyltransferase
MPRGLRTGYTTGACAAAAAKAAALKLVTGSLPAEVTIALPRGGHATFAVEADDVGRAVVVKDAGDDPDCTHGAHITVEASHSEVPGITLRGGEGVGTVTRPGLGLPVGAPAINPVPRRMIEQEVREVTDLPLALTISVPGGEEMARATTNARLGIIGGISILGTTGIVKPFSTASYRASIVQQIDVAAANGERHLVLVTGSKSDEAARRLFPTLDPVAIVEVGDYTGVAIKRAAGHAPERISWVGMAGKIGKLAQGQLMTHFHRSHLDTELVADIARAAGASPELVAAATATTTARHFFEACRTAGDTRPLVGLCRRAKDQLQAAVAQRCPVTVYMLDPDTLEVAATSEDPV